MSLTYLFSTVISNGDLRRPSSLMVPSTTIFPSAFLGATYTSPAGRFMQHPGVKHKPVSAFHLHPLTSKTISVPASVVILTSFAELGIERESSTILLTFW